MARIVAFVPDLLFGSNVVGALRAAGHEPVLASDMATIEHNLPGSELLIVDLTSEAAVRIEQISALNTPRPKVLAFYSHVESEVRERAQQAGFELVVPRSRMARDGANLVNSLLARV